MLWIILIVLIFVGACTINFTELKLFGKIVTFMFGITFAFCLLIYLIVALTSRIDEANNKKQQQEEYWKKVKQTPLIQWACNSDGYKLHLAERPQYVYQCSTGKLIAHSLTGLGEEPYWCESSHKQVNHWKFCEHKANLSNSKYNNLLGK
jgi:uncharacterized membrane protein